MIAIDSLVHNWLHRTGIADRWGTPHVYGDKCYSTGGCAEIVERLAVRIDARNFRADYPKSFPAVCAEGDLVVLRRLPAKSVQRQPDQ